MSMFQTYLYACIFIGTCVLLSLVNSLQDPDPFYSAEYESTEDYDSMDLSNESTLEYKFLDYGKFNLKATFKGSQIMITGLIIEYENGTRAFALNVHYRVVVISKFFTTQGDGKLDLYDDFNFEVCPMPGFGGIGIKAITTILGG